MFTFGLTAIVLLLALLAIWVVMRQLRVYSRTIRVAPARLPYEPVVDPNPPPKVVRTNGVVTVAAAVLIWAWLHIISAAVWAATGYVVHRTVVSFAVAVYVVAAGAVTTIGSLMLLRCERYGRRTIAMGQFLFALAAFMGTAVALLMPRSKDVPSEWYVVAAYLAGVMAAHLLVDAVLGAAAQRVGIPAAAEDEAAPAGG